MVVTFTNAAASEMRERILNAIYKKIEENPKDIHLQKQITLLNKSSICTIHSFCLDIIRNYFYEIDVSANFQIGDTSEMELLKQEVLEELFEEKYIQKDEGFLKLIDTYATYRGDEQLKELILKIENQIQSSPFPESWLKEKVEMFNLREKLDIDFSKTIWGEILLNEILEEIIENRLKLENVKNNLEKYLELEKYLLTITDDINQLKELEDVIKNNKENTWDLLYQKVQQINFTKWPIDKKITIEYKNEAKEIRDKVKKSIISTINKNMIYSSKEANETINKMYPILDSLKNVIIEFEKKFTDKKKEKNRIDFHDIEHLALKILIEKEENGRVIPSKVAEEIQDKFYEIAIDEYQDSNLVQEYILNSVSKGNNIFMVGDIKQSIYRFRQARPELFIEKYKNYSNIADVNQQDILINNKMSQRETSLKGHKIQLFRNFRSREEVLNLTNFVFQEIMSEKLGDIDYNETEYLNLGADYQKEDNMDLLPELHILDLSKQEDSIWKQENDKESKDNKDNLEVDKEENEEEERQLIEKNVEEAKMVANRIEELINSGFIVYDKKKQKRKITYKDIAILLRTTTNIAPIYEKELLNKQFPVFCDSSSQYLDTTEINTILSLLKIIDNPMQDIPLVTVLRSPIGNFTDNDLVEIRFADSNKTFYEALIKSRISANENLRNKIDYFLENLETWKEVEKEKPLDELIWQIYQDTNYYNYVGLLSNGELRQANLKMLFEKAKQYETASFKGLYHFIHFIDRLKLSSGDLSSAKIVGENDNVIRIMSIHKSKGLEFPVVFLCGTGKQFNKQDLNESILIHQDLGFGPKFIDSEKRIEFPTLAKEAIKLKLETEMISEEMRVLYVALTRAKEKLIITGTTKDYEKSCREKEEMISLYKQDEKNKIEDRLLKKYISYLDWFILLSTKDTKQSKMKIYVHKLNEIKEKDSSEQTELIEETAKTINKEELDNITRQLEWKYPYIISSKVPTMTSVSEIKEQKQEETNEKHYNLKEPIFVIENNNISSARKGSLIHLCMQKIDTNKDYTEQGIKELIQELVDKEIILKEEANIISVTSLLKYLKSDLVKELKQSKEIHKEEAFYLEIEANRLDKDYPKEDKILVQGIIDLYYINKNNELVLVDYKTDYIEKGQENIIINRYKEQLYLYKEALEKSLNKKVDKVMIYSTWIGEILLNC